MNWRNSSLMSSFTSHMLKNKSFKQGYFSFRSFTQYFVFYRLRNGVKYCKVLRLPEVHIFFFFFLNLISYLLQITRLSFRWPHKVFVLKLFLCRFCAFTWNASGMRSCIRSRLAAMCPSHWRAWTCDLSWLKKAHLKLPPTICFQLFVTMALQEVWDDFISYRLQAFQMFYSCFYNFIYAE